MDWHRNAVEPRTIIVAPTSTTFSMKHLMLGARIGRDALASGLAITLGSVETRYLGNTLDSITYIRSRLNGKVAVKAAMSIAFDALWYIPDLT